MEYDPLTQQCVNPSVHPVPIDMREVKRSRDKSGTVHVTFQCPRCSRMAVATLLESLYPLRLPV